MRVGIVAQRGNTRAATLAADVLDRLREVGETGAVDEATAATLGTEGEPASAFAAYDLVVSIGGDGTFLFAAHNADTTPVLGVNLGEVGFLNAVAPGDAIDTVLTEVGRFRTTGRVRSQPVPRLQATDHDADERASDEWDAGDGERDASDNEEWAIGPAINEVVVQAPRRGHGGRLSVEVRVDGSLYTATRADGVLVATPTGSTAYNLSEGGPLLHPGIDGLVVTGMSPREPMPPVGVAPDSEIVVRADDADEVVVATDGSLGRRLPAPQQVRIERTAEPARVAGPRGEFFQALSKLE